MARYLRLEVLNTIVDTGIVPVFYQPELETAKLIVRALSAGGARAVEFTNRGDNAYRVFSDLVTYFQKEDPGLILGVGSVVDAPTGTLYISSGANFVVGPVLNAELARLCNRRKVAYSPGCGSASEISDAEELGAEIIKIFPGDSVGGPQFLKTILGPMPWTRMMPTGGVEATPESVGAWIKAGAAAVGMGSNLVKKEWVGAGNYEAISRLTALSIGWVRQARGRNNFCGIEHVGLYPAQSTNAKETADWYAELFGFTLKEGNSSIFLETGGPERIEVSKTETGSPCHLAVRVADFEQAVESLQAKGVELDTPSLKPEIKTVYLKNTDPAGHRVHLVWRK